MIYIYNHICMSPITMSLPVGYPHDAVPKPPGDGTPMEQLFWETPVQQLLWELSWRQKLQRKHSTDGEGQYKEGAISL